MLKIIAGEFRSRRLVTPHDEDSTTRPYASRVKESVFNLLRGWFDEATVLDLFAGVGTMGLEALSRGAARVVLVESHRQVFSLLEQNIAALNCAAKATAICGDALGTACLLRCPRPVDIIFVDPPYEMMEREASRNRVLGQIARCRELMGDRGFVILRSPFAATQADFSIAGFEGPEAHAYGPDMHVLMYAPATSQSTSDQGAS